ncbi:hypothetical protein [Paracoccus alcaliphilus]|uniref:hypothetical protein n=1 Tax=Paracoccus alcaliphilus TaxID=34002 RepID=UPI000B882BCD|nr:hypothetical protein [Paracoccus alcaliphilus]WCR17098.1 hypothetical protein JHW40_11940 [Paracoccus alcaliphilus]
MKTTAFVIAILASFSMPALSDDKIDRAEYCGNYSKTAIGIMEARQSGIPAIQAMEYYMEAANPDQRKIITDFILSAYARTRMMGEEGKATAITDFGDDVWVECMSEWNIPNADYQPPVARKANEP